MKPRIIRALVIPGICLSVLTAGCGEFIRSDRAPVTLIITALEAARGSSPDQFEGNLVSDVLIDDGGGTFNDVGRVSMRLILKDPGQPGVTNAPSGINQVTITRYRVVYRRSDGRNVPGVDVPHAFDGGVTFTVPPEGVAQAGFELVRNVAKLEPPLSTLRFNSTIISSIADVTFYGHDQAGNAISTTGSIQVSFGSFIDEE